MTDIGDKRIFPWSGIFAKEGEKQRIQIERLLQRGENERALLKAREFFVEKESGKFFYQAGCAARRLHMYSEAIEYFLSSFDGQYNRGLCADAIAACHKSRNSLRHELSKFQESSLTFPGDVYERFIWLEELSRGIRPDISYQVMKNYIPKEAREQYVDAHLSKHIDDITELLFANAWGEAKTQCEKILTHFTSPRILAAMGYMYFQTGRYREATKYCEAANLAGGRDTYNSYFLGLSLYQLGRHEEAMKILEAVHQSAPTFFEVVTPLTQCFVQLFDTDTALEKFGALKAGLDFAEHEERLVNIAFQFFGTSVELSEPLVSVTQVTGLDWIKTGDGAIIWTEVPHGIPVKTPFVIGQSYNPVETNVTSNTAYVGEVKNATVFSKSNIVLTTDNFAIDDIGADHRFGKFVSHHIDQAVLAQHNQNLLMNPSDFHVKHIEAGIMMSGAASGEFGHWVPEFLPKLQYYERHPDFSQIPLILDEDMPQSHIDYLKCVAPDHACITLKAGEALKCQTLIYAPTVTFFPTHLLEHSLSPFEIGPVSPQSYEFLKRKIEAKFGTPHPQGHKIYLTRRNMSWSKLSNEAAVAEILSKRGFEIIKIEDMTFENQVKMFQQASVVVAAGGSALQNIIFSHPTTQLIVMTQNNLHNWGCFNAQVGALGYEPVFVCGDAQGDAGTKNSNYEIPLADLEVALTHIGV